MVRLTINPNFSNGVLTSVNSERNCIDSFVFSHVSLHGAIVILALSTTLALSKLP